MFVAIGNTPRDYAWGSSTAIAEFRGVAPSGEPEAELWLGAHAGSPAQVSDAASVGHADLAAWIAADPERALGPALAAHGARLPFLLKLLAAAEPLSQQAHPTPEQARAGFAREEADGIPLTAYDRNYRDAFHKPELIVAVSDTFDALSGFRPLDEVAGILEVLREADAADAAPEPGALDLLAAHLDTADPLRDTVEWLLRDGRGGDTGEAAWVTERVTVLAASDAAGRSPFAPSFATVGALAEAYPGDPGIVISLLLNRVRLRRGEALYLAAGNIRLQPDRAAARSSQRNRGFSLLLLPLPFVSGSQDAGGRQALQHDSVVRKTESGWPSGNRLLRPGGRILLRLQRRRVLGE